MGSVRPRPVVEAVTATTLVATGWDALARGSWAEAARAFDEALAIDGADPRSLEGRAWAAWWLAEPDVLFPTRERAFHVYREHGDQVAAGRVAVWLGCDHHDFRGEHAIANGWYQRARRLLEEAPIAAEHAWLAFHEGAYAIELAEDTETAKRCARETMAIARSLDLDDLVFLGLALEGLALVTEGSLEEGMRSLDEASLAAASGEFSERIPRSWTLCYMIYACERVRDFGRTAQWCRKMHHIALQSGSDFALGVCRAHYGGVLVLNGDWDRAEHELHEASATLARVHAPVVSESDVRLGELRRRQGRPDEAEGLFQRALPHPLAVLGLANIALDRGAAMEAVELAEDLIGSTPSGSLTQLADALQLLAVAQARLGEVDAARAAAASLDEIASMIGTGPLRAMAAAVNGAVALADGDAARARRCYEKAADLFERGGLPFEGASARSDLAIALGLLGRGDAAAVQIAAAERQLQALGASQAVDRVSLAHRSSSGSAAEPATVRRLTRRETEVLAALAEGLTDREIAERLSISSHTVHRHVSNLFRKLGVRSRAAAVAHGIRHGLAR